MKVTYSVELLEATINKQVERIAALEAELEQANEYLNKTVKIMLVNVARIEALEAALREVMLQNVEPYCRAIAKAALAPEQDK